MNKVLLLLMLTVTGMVFADDHEDDPCGHPEFVTHECLSDFFDGIDGSNGIGVDGVDGQDGATGPAGPIGPMGPAGLPGKDFTRELRIISEEYGQYLAATEAAQIYLPQDKSSRLTFGMSRVRGNTGVGVGYALKLDDEDRTAFTLSLGVSGGQATGKVSVGFEF